MYQKIFLIIFVFLLISDCSKKEELSNSKTVKPTIWGQLQAHTIDECEFVNVKSRQQPLIFNKSKKLSGLPMPAKATILFLFKFCILSNFHFYSSIFYSCRFCVVFIDWLKASIS